MRAKYFCIQNEHILHFAHFFVIIIIIVLAQWQHLADSEGKAARRQVNQREWMRALRGLSWLTQLGLGVATPIVLCILGAHWLCGRFGLGGWVYVPALVLGIGAGAASFASFAKRVERHARKTQKRPPDRP